METNNNNNNNNAEKQEVKNNETAQQAQEQPNQQEQKFEEVGKTNNEPGFFEKAVDVTTEFCKEHKSEIAVVGGAIVSGIIGFFCGKSCSNKD